MTNIPGRSADEGSSADVRGTTRRWDWATASLPVARRVGPEVFLASSAFIRGSRFCGDADNAPRQLVC